VELDWLTGRSGGAPDAVYFGEGVPSVDPASSGVTRVVAVKPAEIVVSLAPA
jgi:hypothetical protein